MNRKPEISVIVPMYKVEKYINRCIDSILCQTYSDFELLLVDDGSPDSCYEIGLAYSKKDERVRIFHKENGGLSDARNFGTARANGKYITFIDSDDYVSSDYLATLIGMLNENDADIAVGFYSDVTDTATLDAVINEDKQKTEVYSGDEALHLLLASSMYLQMETAWGKLIKTEIVKKHPFPVGRLHEDEATTYLYYYDANVVAVTYRKIYGYYQNPNSIMRSERSEKNIKDALWSFAERAKTLERLGKTELAKSAWLFAYGWLLEEVMKAPGNRWKWKETYRDIRNARYVKLHIKEKAFIYMHFPHLFGLWQRSKEKR